MKLREALERCAAEEKLFTVIDNTTGEYPDLRAIALNEKWADGLIWCDMEGFYIGEYGDVMLMDECGGERSVPEGRFTVVPDLPAALATLTRAMTELLRFYWGGIPSQETRDLLRERYGGEIPTMKEARNA